MKKDKKRTRKKRKYTVAVYSVCLINRSELLFKLSQFGFVFGALLIVGELTDCGLLGQDTTLGEGAK